MQHSSHLKLIAQESVAVIAPASQSLNGPQMQLRNHWGVEGKLANTTINMQPMFWSDLLGTSKYLRKHQS